MRAAQCSGRGIIYTDLAFMDPVTTTCQVCEGRRFNDDVLKHRVGGRSIVDVLEMTAAEAVELFDDRALLRKLHTLNDVGLTYLTLGQPLSSLSGGERQRIKLATQLHRTGSVYVLDEPTTGLHMADTGRSSICWTGSSTPATASSASSTMWMWSSGPTG